MRVSFFGKTGVLTFALLVCSSTAFSGVPEGYVPYDGLKDQFTIALPEGWSAYNQNQALSGRSGSSGMVFFTAQAITKEGEKTADPNLLSQVDTGAIPSFFVDRQPAVKGMSCAKFTKTASYDLGVKITKDPIFGAARSYFAATPIHHDDVSIGGCQGVHYKGEGKKGEWVLDVRAVSDGRVLYLFSLRNKAENFAKNVDTYEKAIGTVQITRHE